jgi:hypothetical protein
LLITWLLLVVAAAVNSMVVAVVLVDLELRLAQVVVVQALKVR